MTRIEEALRAHWWVFIVLVVTLAGTIAREGEHPAVAGVLAGVAVLALLLRRGAPEATVVVTVAATTAYFAIGYANGPVYLSIFCSAFALSVRRPLAHWWRWALLYLVLLAGLATRSAVDGDGVGAVAAWTSWFAAWVAASLAVGSAVRGRGETRRERVVRTATEERLRMAEDLHDGVGHGLAVIAMQAGVALHVLDKDPGSARASLEAIRDTSRESLDALRTSLSRLAPAEATRTGAVAAEAAPRSPRRGLADLDVLFARVRAGGLAITADVTADVAAASEPSEAGETAYVVVQEALTNVLRHAHASTARVRISVDADALLVSVRDDGQGGDMDAQPGSGLGIPAMRSRVERLGGTLAAGPVAGGFEVAARIPREAR